jgi:hypothetical protein
VKAFAIYFDSPTPEQSAEIITALRKRDVTWWHHMEGLWLVADDDSDRDAAWWFGYSAAIVRNVSVIVFEVTHGGWAGRVPNAGLAWLEKVFNGERFEFQLPQLARVKK